MQFNLFCLFCFWFVSFNLSMIILDVYTFTDTYETSGKNNNTSYFVSRILQLQLPLYQKNYL